MTKQPALFFILGLIFTFAAGVLIYSLEEFLPPLIPLWYTNKWGPLRLGPPSNLYIVVFLSLGILLLNALLYLLLRAKREETVAQIFVLLGTSAAFFLSYSVWRIVTLVGPKNFLLGLEIKLLLPFVAAFLLSLTLTWATLKVGRHLRIIDRPHGPYEKVRPLVRLGGISLFASFIIGAISFTALDKHLLALIFGGLLIIVVGLADDLYSLSPWVLGASHLLAALVLILGGIGMDYIRNPLSPFIGGNIVHLDIFKIPFQIGDLTYHLTVFSDLFTLFWVFGLTNIVNWIDGLDGLATGVGLIASLALFAISFKFGTPLPATLSLILVGVLLGFLLFNFYPAKIILGSGGYLLGFFLATLAIYSEGRTATALLVLALPVLDTVIVLLNRFREGKPLYLGDKTHLHHRLLEKGLTVRQVVVLEWVICLTLGAVSLFLTGLGKLLATLLVLLGGLLVHYLPGIKVAGLANIRQRSRLG